MKKNRLPLLAAMFLELTLCASAQAAESAYSASVQQWRKQADEKIRAADGPLAAIGLYWLRPGVNRVGAFPSNEVVLPSDVASAKAGVIKVDDGRIAFEAGDAADVRVDGQSTRQVALQQEGAGSPSSFNIGRLKLSVVGRDLGLAVRVTDPNSAARRDFQGQQWYPVNESWVVEGRFVPFDAPKTLVYEAATGGTRTGISPGYVSFERNGIAYRLEVQKTSEQGYIAFFFDGTTGKSTYAGGRVVPIEKAGGDVVKLDFNKAFNMPCAVSAYFNCQIAPPQNRLSALEIPAGEKKPLAKVQRVASAPEYIK
ncbi:DUF1684 domain-containing protein [Herbaspirillum sp. HC18]|nr:DUF1684 domain-containing protein [Herbaspirillum sp. HC18]